MTAETDAMRLVPDISEMHALLEANRSLPEKDRPIRVGYEYAAYHLMKAAAPAVQPATAVALSASDRACYDYPGVDQVKERAAFVAGAEYAAQVDAGAVQPAAGRATIEFLEERVSDETMRALLSCKDVGSGRAHLASILADLAHPPAQGSESGGEKWSLLKARVDTLVNILAPDQGEMLTEDGRRLFAIASAIQSDLATLSQPGPASEGDGE